VLPLYVADVLRKHVALEVESIDRMYLNAIVPRLKIVEGALRFIRQQRGAEVASPNAVEPMTRNFVEAIEEFVRQRRIPTVNFQKGQRKDELAAQMRARFLQRDGVVFVGKAQEKCTVYRTEKRHNPKTKRAYAWIVKSTALVNHYYCCLDENFGSFFLKFCSYFPYKRQALSERQPVRQTTTGARRHRLSGLGQRHPVLRRSKAATANLRLFVGGQDRRTATQMAPPFAASLSSRRPRCGLPLPIKATISESLDRSGSHLNQISRLPPFYCLRSTASV
jgi:hypothetical protein